jgi:hypothetical protein
VTGNGTPALILSHEEEEDVGAPFQGLGVLMRSADPGLRYAPPWAIVARRFAAVNLGYRSAPRCGCRLRSPLRG